MRQTFFHELKDLEKQEDEEEKERVELYLRSRSAILRDSIPLISIIFIVLFSLGAGVYALYLFIDVSKISDVSNVHVTKSFNLAARTMQGAVFNDEAKGIKNWMLHKDFENGFEIAHPESWIMVKSDRYLLEIKKYNSQKSSNESLAAKLYLDKIENTENLSSLEIIIKDTALDPKAIKKEIINGKEFMVTGRQIDESGLYYNKIFWNRRGVNYRIMVMYYNQNNKEAESDINKILAEIKIL